MTTTRPGEPTPTPRPGTGPKMPENDKGELLQPENDTADRKSASPEENDDYLHPQEMSREEVESEMPADPDPDDPVAPS